MISGEGPGDESIEPAGRSADAGWDHSERRSTLAALRTREQQYRAIFDGSIDGMVLWDEDLRVVDVNEAFVRMTGLRRDEVVGRHWSERADAHDFERLLGLIRGALDDRVGEATTTVTRVDGSLFEIEVRYLPVHLDERRYALGIGRDVSERLQQERALQRSEAQYRGIFNASADALVLRDAAFRIVDVNATYESMSGYARDEVLGVDRVLANPLGVQSTIRELHERALAGTPITLETELVRRDGRRYALELRGVPIEHRGEPHVLYIGRDITVAKRAQAELRDSEEQYRAIFNASADGLVLRDKNYRAVDVNPAYLMITGFSRDEVLSADRVLAQPDETTQRRHRDQHDRILAGESVRFEAAGLRKDGSKVEVEVSAKPLMYRGEPHVLYAARDIGERREAEARSAELQQQLRQAQKMEAVGQLTGGIAHDFNNILTSVIGYVVLGLERAEALRDATLQRQLGQAHRAAQRARELIMQMLAFARRQRGERRALALAPLVQQSLQLLRATLPSSAVVDFVAVDDVPNVLADPVQLEQVLFNLCINARDAIQGAGFIRVRLGWHRGPWRCASCRAAGEQSAGVELSVADSGTGIAADMLERIFEPFVSTKEVGRGSGMGLAMVHGIVHDHGGHVLVETRQGAGTVFRVVLPPAGIDVPADPRPATASASVDSRHALSGRVLLVEDETMVGDFMAELLTSWGLDVVLKREPLAALAWLEDPANAVDLLITDQTMPQLAGLALAKGATSLRAGLPVLLYSGNAESFDVAELERSGVRAALRKPVDAEKLRALLARWLAADRIASRA